MNSVFVENSLNEAQCALNRFTENKVQIANIYTSIELLVQSIQNGGRIFSCGNGGSLCDAMHFAEELTGRYRKNRAPLPGVAISDPSHICCVGNDFGYEHIFSRYIDAHGNSSDCLVGLSTSGKSRNVIEAIKVAKRKGMKVIFLTGNLNSDISDICDVQIVAEGFDWADRVQEIHIKILHIFIEGIERALFPENYK